MIKMIQKMFCWVHGEDNSQDIKESGYELNKLYNYLKQDYYCPSINKICELSRDVHYMRGSTKFRIDNFRSKSNKHASSEILENFPDARVVDRLDLIDVLYIDFSMSKYNRKISKLSKCEISVIIIPTLTSIINKISKQPNRSYTMLLDKYDSIFYTLAETIKELKETDTLDEEAKNKIIAVIQAFIDEFNSLESLYNKQKELDHQAIKDSLKRRLDEELDLVNKIKTNWNAEFQKEEVKIEI